MKIKSFFGMVFLSAALSATATTASAAYLLAQGGAASDCNRSYPGTGSADNFVVNTDARLRYKVTLRTQWSNYQGQGRYDQVYYVPAGGRVFVGCSVEGYPRSTRNSFFILNQAPG